MGIHRVSTLLSCSVVLNKPLSRFGAPRGKTLAFWSRVCNAAPMATTTQKRIRPVAVLTLDPTIHARLVALAARSGLSLSRVVDAVLTRQLDLPAA